MFKSILVPIDLADTDLAKPAIATAATLSQMQSGAVRLLNVLPMTPVMLAEYVPPDFDAQQRQTSEEALTIVARESGIDAPRISSVVRQGGIYHEILEEAAAVKADLIVMTSHRPAMRTYFLGSNAGHVVRYAKCSVLVVRPVGDETARLVGLDLVPFREHTPTELRICVPERARRRKSVDGQQHLFHLGPMAVQRHRIAARRPGIAEADHAADVRKPQLSVDDGERENHVFAGILGAMFLQNEVRRNAALDHRLLDDRAFRAVRSRRDAAADNGPAKIAGAPKPAGFPRAQGLVDARAKHEQEIGRLERGLGQMRRIDLGDLRRARQPVIAIGHGSNPCGM
jgi:nucleotide-binding universal stress UspA family protein